MASAQARIAETISLFYSADRASDVSWRNIDKRCEADSQGAMAGHAYKAAVDELDAGVGRELVSVYQSFGDAELKRRTLHTGRLSLNPLASSIHTSRLLTVQSTSVTTRFVLFRLRIHQPVFPT